VCLKQKKKLKIKVMTYRSKRINPQMLFFFAFILLFMFVIWQNCKGQYFEITKHYDACENYENAYITGYYPGDVHSISWEVFYDSCNWELKVVCRSDVFINGFLLDSIYDNRYVFSWFSIDPLPCSDTLLQFIFLRKGYIGGGEIEWDVECEITDFNAVIIPAQYNSGWLRCFVGIDEKTIRKTSSFRNYNLLGQYVRFN